MAEEQAKRRLKIRKSETVRERKASSDAAKPKSRRLRRSVSAVTGPIGAARRIGGKEYYLPLPDSRFGRFLNKRRYLMPRYFRESFKELKLVKWPNRKETTQLTFAVFIFAVIFGITITITDYGLDKLFKKVLLK